MRDVIPEFPSFAISRFLSCRTGARVGRPARKVKSREAGEGEVEKLRREVEELQRANAGLAAELEGLRTYYEDLLSSLQDGVIIVDAGGRIQALNQAAEELTGLSGPVVRGKSLALALPRPSPLEGLVQKTLALARGHADFDVSLARADGGVAYVSAIASVLADAQGEARGAVLVLRDVSRVRDLEERLRRSERLAALGVLAAGLAHEVRNPLAGVRGAAQLLEKEKGFAPGFREYTAVIAREVERLNRIVDDLLAFASPRPATLRPCNVNQILEEGLVLEEPDLRRRGIPLVRLYDPEIPPVAAEAHRLHQVFLNLVRNAREAMPAGGDLTVRTRFERSAAKCGGRPAAVVEVSDRGPGIPPEIQAQVFNPFFTTKDGGTGLGLAISLRIVEDHGGAIEVQSPPGQGATFRVFLPLASADA